MSRSLERLLVARCSPTLAGLKPGSLFSYHTVNGLRDVAELDRRLSVSGVRLAVMKASRSAALVLAYRGAQLELYLNEERNAAFLSERGYAGGPVELMIARLRQRLRSEEFPHELGLFLGYPLDDVVGFIANNGRDYLLLGCWKVYSDEARARERFESFRICQTDFLRRFDAGAPVEALASVSLAQRCVELGPPGGQGERVAHPAAPGPEPVQA